MRPITISRESILEATISYVAIHGLENVSVKKVAETISVSEAIIFKNYGTKTELLNQCQYYIDAKTDQVLKNAAFNPLQLKGSLWRIWRVYYDFLYENIAYAKFLRQFRQSSYYNDEVMKGQEGAFLFFSSVVPKYMKKLGINPYAFWLFVVMSTLNWAIQVHDGKLPGTEEDIRSYFNLLLYGAAGAASYKAKRSKREISFDELV